MSAWEAYVTTAWDDAAAAYEESVTYSRDAVEWLADCAQEIPDDVMATIVAMYRESARFATVVDDILFESEQQP